MRNFYIIVCLLILALSQQVVSAQQQAKEKSNEEFVDLGMPLEEALTKITFIVTWLSGDGSDEVIFQGENVIRTPDYIKLRIPSEHDNSTGISYMILTKYAVESNRYIFIPLGYSGGGSGLFWELQVVDKKTLRTVDYITLGDRTSVEEVTLADASSNTIFITYIGREVKRIEGDYKVVYDPDKATKSYLRMIEGKLRDVEDPLSPSPPDMMFIPAGEFWMGSDDNDAEGDENPERAIYLDAFYMDKYEVTNAQYKEFIDANPQWQKDRIPRTYHDGDYLKHWEENDYPPDKGDHPVVYVSWYAAMAYAQWQGKRLPTEAEWEKAARGGYFGTDYTWGISPDSEKANYGDTIGDTTPVGIYEANGYGLYDMAGNVWEWCLDEYSADYYAISPRQNPIAGGTIGNILSDWTNVKRVRVLRGGSWMSAAKFVRVSDRTRFTPKFTNKARGFRCVKPVTP